VRIQDEVQLNAKVFSRKCKRHFVHIFPQFGTQVNIPMPQQQLRSKITLPSKKLKAQLLKGKQWQEILIAAASEKFAINRVTIKTAVVILFLLYYQ